MELDINSAEAGQVLTQPVMNNYGQMLMPAGTELLARHIVVLKTWNIKSVHVRGEDELSEDAATGEGVDTVSDDLLRLAENRLKTRLDWTPENDFERELYAIGLKRACEIIRGES